MGRPKKIIANVPPSSDAVASKQLTTSVEKNRLLEDRVKEYSQILSEERSYHVLRVMALDRMLAEVDAVENE